MYLKGIPLTTFSQAFNLTASANAAINPPPQAVNAGFTTLKFNDDFTDASTVDMTGTSASGTKNWYWGTSINSASMFSVQTTTTADMITNGNTSGGNFASSAGGILTITGATDNNNGQLQTVNNHVASTIGVANTFQHCYVEFYVQLNHAGSSTDGPPSGPQIATWSLEDLVSINTDAVHQPRHSQIYMMWYTNPVGYSTTLGDYAAGDGSGGYVLSTNNIPSVSPTNNSIWAMDDEWHLYGMLWTLVSGTAGTSTAVGNIKFYRDNVQVSYPNGANSTGYQTGLNSPQGQVAVEQEHIYFTIGTGNQFPINVDYLRVWTAS